MTAVDFAALPPEVNSARMYAGAGAGPLAAAAAAWDRLAAELNSAASSYRAIISELTGGPWLGPASASMTAAVAPYVEWMGTTGAQAGQTANQARAAVAAYEAAFAATVPPPVIAANRATRALLAANNTFGQNTPAIAANDAQYIEMWTQDATAMHGYAANSTAATTLAPFTPAAQDTNPAAPAAQAADTAQSSGNTSGLLGNLLGLPGQLLTSPLLVQFDDINGVIGLPMTLTTGPEFAALGAQVLVAPLYAAALSFPPYAAGLSSAHDMPAGALGSTLVGSGSGSARLGGAGVSAGLGRAAPVGGLSVPPSWGTVGNGAPEVKLAATALPTAGSAALPQLGLGGLGGMPGVVGSVVNTPKNSEPQSRSGFRSGVGAAMPGQAGGRDDAPGRHAAEIANALSEREREEFNRLREEVTEMVMECEATTRLMGEALRP